MLASTEDEDCFSSHWVLLDWNHQENQLSAEPLSLCVEHSGTAWCHRQEIIASLHGTVGYQALNPSFCIELCPRPFL